MSDNHSSELEFAKVKLPFNAEAEGVVLGAMMMDNNQIASISEILEAEDFFNPMHGRIYTAILLCSARGTVANPVTLKTYLDDDADLMAAGGAGYLARLTGTMGQLLIARQVAMQVKDLARRRRLMTGLLDGIECARNTDIENPLENVIEIADKAINDALATKAKTSVMTVASAFKRTLAGLDDIATGESVPGFAVQGFEDWNRVTDTMRPGDNIILAGRPSMGKTAAAIEVALASARAGHGTLFISLEMSIDQLMTRAISSLIFEPGVSSRFDQVRKGSFTGYERLQLEQIQRDLESWPLIFTDPPVLKASRLPMLVRQYQRQMAARGQELRVVITDYLQLMKATPGRGEMRKHDQIDEISKTLKTTAKECGVAMVTLSQLSRGVESREDKRPQLSDLRESGSIEEDADTVIFVYRPEYYLERSEPKEGPKRVTWEQDMNVAKDRMHLICGKLRNGKISTRQARFYAANQAVRDSDYFSKED